MNSRAIANMLHISKDAVSKYVDKYTKKRKELLRMHPDIDVTEIIPAFSKKPAYDSSNRVPFP